MPKLREILDFMDEYLYGMFLDRVELSLTTSCWIWKGVLDRAGYGVLQSRRISSGHMVHVASHRLSWMLHFGHIPDGMFVCHDCPGGDKIACVNPAHLFLGTPKDNTQDMIKKGRKPVGERHANSKLTEQQVRDIRARRNNGEPCAPLGRDFGVTAMTVHGIGTGKLWKHLWATR